MRSMVGATARAGLQRRAGGRLRRERQAGQRFPQESSLNRLALARPAPRRGLHTWVGQPGRAAGWRRRNDAAERVGDDGLQRRAREPTPARPPPDFGTQRPSLHGDASTVRVSRRCVREGCQGCVLPVPLLGGCGPCDGACSRPRGRRRQPCSRRQRGCPPGLPVGGRRRRLELGGGLVRDLWRRGRSLHPGRGRHACTAVRCRRLMAVHEAGELLRI
mmetsp:Transcript_19611/g.75254  ORF Transcript_19611/g.75254 Transcript_19611/m.75254 type:complete len:218 (+) Transcript_19611:1772-2425(+)